MDKALRNLLAAGAFALAVPLATSASAQYANDPFFDWTVQMSQAYGIEMAMVRVNVLDAIEGSVDPRLIEVVEQMAKADWQRFGGTLTERNPELAAELYEYLAAFEETLEGGQSADELIEPTRELLVQAYDIVVDPAMRESAAFKGALMAQLLLAESGVAEGYEEAEEELFAYSMGWGTLQRVKELWADVESRATADQRDQVLQLIGILDTLYPVANPPAEWVGRNPEEAEAPAQLMLGILETITDASLYAGRDPARLAGHLAETAAPACALIEAGKDDLAREALYPVADHFIGETTGLADLIGLFDPELFDRAEAILPLFVIREENNAVVPTTLQAEYQYGAEACNVLVETLTQARVLLGG